jgi:hypothetical protein
MVLSPHSAARQIQALKQSADFRLNRMRFDQFPLVISEFPSSSQVPRSAKESLRASSVECPLDFSFIDPD